MVSVCHWQLNDRDNISNQVIDTDWSLSQNFAVILFQQTWHFIFFQRAHTALEKVWKKFREMELLKSTFLKFPVLNNQTTDDHHEENSQSAQDHTRQLCWSVTLFYKKDHEIRLNIKNWIYLKCFTWKWLTICTMKDVLKRILLSDFLSISSCCSLLPLNQIKVKLAQNQLCYSVKFC